jgi:ketosteroid isomerase-like protein
VSGSTEEADAEVAIVMRAYRAFARGDIDGAVADLDPEVEWIEPDDFPNGGRRRGPAAVAEYLRLSRAAWSELRSVATPFRRGEQIVVVHHVAGRLADGTPHDATVADAYTFENGRVVRMQAYADPAQALEPGA